MEQLITKLKFELQKPLPGALAQYFMAPDGRKNTAIKSLKTGQYKQSAVLIVFCMDANNELFIPLIERVAYKGVHSAQISFPGGKYEQSDGNLERTAMRECFEEIGLSGVEVIGKLTHLFIPVSSFLVEPYVAFCKISNPGIVIQEREVKSALKLGINQLLDENSLKYGTIEAEDYKIKTPYFLVGGNKIWGATAMILNELKVMLKTIL